MVEHVLTEEWKQFTVAAGGEVWQVVRSYARITFAEPSADPELRFKTGMVYDKDRDALFLKAGQQVWARTASGALTILNIEPDPSP